MLDLDAGKYAAYVWSAFAITALVLAWMVIDSLWRARRWRKAAERLEREGTDPAP
jgi:heme exporter protein D